MLSGVVIAWDGTQGPSTTSEGNPRRQQVAKDPAWRRRRERRRRKDKERDGEDSEEGGER